MSMSRKDSKGRVLRKGESQRKNDGRYIYQYSGATAISRYFKGKGKRTCSQSVGRS